MVEVDLLDFIETFKRLAKQTLEKHGANPPVAGSPTGSTSSFTDFGVKKVTVSVKPRIG